MGFLLLLYVDVDCNTAVGSSSNRETMSQPFWGHSWDLISEEISMVVNGKNHDLHTQWS